jgi:hypothetical protein
MILARLAIVDLTPVLAVLVRKTAAFCMVRRLRDRQRWKNGESSWTMTSDETIAKDRDRAASLRRRRRVAIASEAVSAPPATPCSAMTSSPVSGGVSRCGKVAAVFKPVKCSALPSPLRPALKHVAYVFLRRSCFVSSTLACTVSFA